MSLPPGGGGGSGSGGGRKGGAEDRIKKYKAGVDVDDARRRREEDLVGIRKTKRGDSLAKKRRGVSASSSAENCASPASDVVHALAADRHPSAPDACLRHAAGPPSRFDHVNLENISEMAHELWSEDVFTLMDATTYFRKLLSIEQNPPVDVVIKAGIVPRLVQLLVWQDKPDLQFEAAWALTNITSGSSEHTKIVIEHGAIPILVQLLSSPSEEVREQAVWTLGNIAGDSSNCRDLVLANDVLIPLLSLFNAQSKLSILRNASWTLSNLFRGKPSVQTKQITLALPVFQQLIHSNDDEILTSVCWAFSYLSNGPNDNIHAVINTNVCLRLMQLLRHPSPSVLLSALRTVGNIVAGDDTQTQFVIDSGLLFCLLQLLKEYHSKIIKKEACWVISNITAGNKTQIQAVLDVGIIPPLLHLLEHAEFDIKKEAAWAISNAISRGSPEQICFFASEGCIKPLYDLLTCPDPHVVLLCLKALEDILKVGEVQKDLGNNNWINLYAQEVEDCEGLDKIENLQSHDNIKIL